MTNALKDADLAAGFADPVMQAQSTFRLILDAMSRPGTTVSCGAELTPPASVHAAAAAFLLTVADFETPVWLPASQADSGFATWLKFHCSCPIAPTPDCAAFALIDIADEMPSMAAFGQGTEEYPDRATTLIIQVDHLDRGQNLALSGPGIKDKTALSVSGLPATFWSDWRANNTLFPCGVDLMLTAGTQLAALPRTVKVEI
ncbi:MAG: phosphonate C-P lyase system protein PhnH [Rhodospirillales bacterium]|nr:phosphonate C-P lyase system protein PhnH [Rhodospirillales bacterium]